jgi:hypothetical protein
MSSSAEIAALHRELRKLKVEISRRLLLLGYAISTYEFSSSAVAVHAELLVYFGLPPEEAPSTRAMQLLLVRYALSHDCSTPWSTLDKLFEVVS